MEAEREDKEANATANRMALELAKDRERIAKEEEEKRKVTMAPRSPTPPRKKRNRPFWRDTKREKFLAKREEAKTKE